MGYQASAIFVSTALFIKEACNQYCVALKNSIPIAMKAAM
jgi:hypothetical protein